MTPKDRRWGRTDLHLRAGVWCFASLMVAAGYAHAHGSLWPTHVRWENDACSSYATVWARPSDFSRGVEVGRCTVEHADNTEKKIRCIKEADKKGVGFFTEQCSHDFTLSVDGVEYSLKKWVPGLKRFLSYEEMPTLRSRGDSAFSSKLPVLVGEFEGEGFKLRVFNPKLVDRELDEKATPEDDPVLSETFRVQVELRRGKVTKKFPATLGVGHK